MTPAERAALTIERQLLEHLDDDAVIARTVTLATQRDGAIDVLAAVVEAVALHIRVTAEFEAPAAHLTTAIALLRFQESAE